MKSLRAMLVRFAGLFRRGAREAEMNAELQAHLDGLTERHVGAGLSAEAARYAALREFGGVAQIQERARDERRSVWVENFGRDVGYSARTLRQSLGFTSIVVLTLALGVGVNTALFTWFNAAAFRPLPVADPEQLFALTRLNENGNQTWAMSYTDYVTYRDHQTVLAGLAASAGSSVELVVADEFNSATGETPSQLHLETVSTNYFSVFGVPMALGRPLVPTDETSSGAQPVIVLSHRFWQNHFSGDPNVIGRTLRLRGLAEETLSIVGVTGPEFFGTRPGARAGWVPLLMRSGQAWRTDAKATNFTLTARLRPGVSPEQAVEELQVIANQSLARRQTSAGSTESIVLAPASRYLNLTVEMLAVLLPMVCLFGAVFVISCANASNLILARTVTRQFEFAVRSALGATRGRLFTMLITESLILGVLGGVAGWAVAAGLLRFALPWLLDMVPGAREGTAGLNLHADHRVFGFTLAVSILAGVAGGLLPALHVTRRNLISALNREGSPFGRKLQLSRIRSILAVGQVALSAALLFVAGLLVQRALQTQFQEVGFDKSRLLTFEVLAPRTYGSGELDSARLQVLERLRGLPEVTGISEMPRFPFAPSRAKVSVAAPGTAEARAFAVLHLSVPPNYLATLQLPLVRGRFFAVDETRADHVAVISETAAREFWPDQDPLGQRIDVPTTMLGAMDSAAASMNEADLPRTSVTVVGVARDTRVYDPLSGDRAIIYLPLPPATGAAPYLLIRTSTPVNLSHATFRDVGREVTGIAPRLATVDEVFAGVVTQYRVIAWLAGILAAISLIVAVIGLYGVMSFTVNQRVKEIGIRMALGATPRRVASGIVWECLWLVGVGAIVGCGLSVVIAMAARRLLFGVSPFEPVVCGVLAVFLVAIGILASWMPARRASQVDPMVALRAE